MAKPLTLTFGGTTVLLKYSHGVLSPSPFSRFLAETLATSLGTTFVGVERAIDLGSGSGIQGILLAKLGVREVYAVDVDPRSAAATEFNALLNGVSEWAPAASIIYSHLGDMFTPLSNLRADVIVCNPPSLPLSEDTPQFARGGQYPQEFLDRLISTADEMLAANGRLIFVTSSLAGLKRTVGKLEEAGMLHRIIARKREKCRDFYYPHISYYRRSKLDGVAHFRELANGELEETLYVIEAWRG